MTSFDVIVAAIRVPENYVPRNYQTIGGMWTVETWSKNGVTVKMMDEGYTTVIETGSVSVQCSFTGENTITFQRGDQNDLDALAASIK